MSWTRDRHEPTSEPRFALAGQADAGLVQRALDERHLRAHVAVRGRVAVRLRGAVAVGRSWCRRRCRWPWPTARRQPRHRRRRAATAAAAITFLITCWSLLEKPRPPERSGQLPPARIVAPIHSDGPCWRGPFRTVHRARGDSVNIRRVERANRVKQETNAPSCRLMRKQEHASLPGKDRRNAQEGNGHGGGRRFRRRCLGGGSPPGACHRDDDGGTTSASGNGAEQAYGNAKTSGDLSPQASAGPGLAEQALCRPARSRSTSGSLVGVLVPVAVPRTSRSSRPRRTSSAPRTPPRPRATSRCRTS